MSPPPWTMDQIGPIFQAHIADHPVVAYAERTRDGQAMAISDFITARQFHATRLYRELFGPMGIEDQLSIGMVGSAGLMIGLSFNRSKRGFAQRDRQILNLLRPHLLQAFLNCQQLQMFKNSDGIRRGTVIDRLPVGLICVDRKGAVLWSTEPAGSMLRKYYTDAGDSIHGLPHALRLWIKSVSTKSTAELLKVSRPDFNLTIRHCPLKNRNAVLLLQETAATQIVASLDSYGMTIREEQVMQTLLTGITVAQAAKKLQISPRTLQKHLERIFKKLEVGSLSAAMVRLLR